jgi:3-deoxy-7-phosphoheptulonate synthase
MPIGVKNPTHGDLGVAVNAMRAVAAPHLVLGLSDSGAAAVLRTPGNPDGSLVLRGSVQRPNFHPLDVAAALRALRRGRGADLERPLLVDCSHDNSRQDHRRQGEVARSVFRQIRGGQRAIMGFLLEGHLRPGRQPLGDGRALEYGLSITDACIGWPDTEALLFEAAEAVERSR